MASWSRAQGRAGSRELVEAQNSLLRAQDQFQNAQATLQIAVLRFLRSTGTLRVNPDAGAIGAALNPPPAPTAKQVSLNAAETPK